ncbi:hypothetical protein CAC02_01045 [Streptococcus gallolyticus]|uniref:VOC domain-containing protein n=1 Tax=Streptococcus gallolyticus TaxID=315405 RepID=A0A368UFS7_9STRE|nr:VOC family protein [Streptococcus gallolyticus]RCW17839.1 hypothetical protein CAC02_01045 [Streptococcus gallolyticus]
MNHIKLTVLNVAVSKQFYQPIFEHLGWQLYQEWSEGFSYQKDDWYLVFVQADGNHEESIDHKNKIGFNHIALQAPSQKNFQAIVKHLRENQVEELDSEQLPCVSGKDGLAITVWDPNGMKLEVVCPEQVAKKQPAGKVRHRYRKALALIPFYVDYKGSKATVFWTKSNQLVIKAGAILVPDAPLNKDGSLGFAARFALSLRQEHQDSISLENHRTTADIVLKSVNEVGHFLYFAGTNSWQVLKDETGKSLDDYSR